MNKANLSKLCFPQFPRKGESCSPWPKVTDNPTFSRKTGKKPVEGINSSEHPPFPRSLRDPLGWDLPGNPLWLFSFLQGRGKLPKSAQGCLCLSIITCSFLGIMWSGQQNCFRLTSFSWMVWELIYVWEHSLLYDHASARIGVHKQHEQKRSCWLVFFNTSRI